MRRHPSIPFPSAHGGLALAVVVSSALLARLARHPRRPPPDATDVPARRAAT